VEVGGFAIAEAALEVDLAGSGVQEVGAADDVGDALGFVVDYDGELVGVEAVGSE
jgi:hypothetical protein